MVVMMKIGVTIAGVVMVITLVVIEVIRGF